jgi:hypothetical protein
MSPGRLERWLEGRLSWGNERIVWGIWAPRSLKLAYKVIAADLRVPMCVLVGHVLREWLAENGESLIDDEHKKLEFADYLATKYLANNEIVEE